MVANTFTTKERFVSPPEPVLAGRWRLVRFTREDAETLLRMRIIPEDATTELLDGMIVLKDRSARDEDPTMIGKDHRICVERLSNLRMQINGGARHVESQQPLVCSDTHVPEPDFMVLRGTLDGYVDLPLASDAFCVLEVADSSYERDATVKLAGYAHAGIAQYIIINLRNRTAEVYTVPDTGAGMYSPPQIIAAEGMLPLRVGGAEMLSIPLRDVLP
jgi:hypothetical protein